MKFAIPLALLASGNLALAAPEPVQPSHQQVSFEIYHRPYPFHLSRFLRPDPFDPVSSLLDHQVTVPLHPIVVLPNICTFYFNQIDPSYRTLTVGLNSASQTCISDRLSHGCLHKQSWGLRFHLLT